MQKITPFLWYDGNAEEAVDHYLSIFKNSRKLEVARYGAAGAKASGQPEGSVMTIRFQIEGQRFVALNGGPHFKFTPAISFVVNCRTQKEIDGLWEKLSRGGMKSQCGWLTDKFGVSWQIVPDVVPRMVQDKTKSERVMAALMKMRKIDIKTLLRAQRGTNGKKRSKR